MGVVYKIKDYSKEFLKKHKFRYCSHLSECIDDIYTYKFPVVNYKKITTIECEISVSTMTGVVNVNVYNAGTMELYPSYYDRKYGNCKFIKSIDLKIDKKLKELGIEKA